MEELDPTAVQQLSEAVQSGDISAIIGLALLLIVPALGYVLQNKLEPVATKVVSILRAAISGIGVGLVTTASAGGDWWFGVLIGSAGLLASAGFLDLVRSAIPDHRSGT